MESTYSPELIESKWYQYWLQHSLFSPGNTDAQPYCIMIPPPNVTGTLHMGHAFQHTVIDVLIRHQRMLGKNVLWQMGSDHAGIATQMVVERQLLAEGTSSQQLGREEFIKRVWHWKEFSSGTIEEQIKRLGASIDWSNTRFTMDEEYQNAVTQTFIALHEQGLIYRSHKLVNWDPKLLTSISDLEVINIEEKGKLYTVRYPFVDGSGHMTIATTRPETILADGALAVAPNDSRYAHLVGKKVWVPMSKRQIPIVEDDYVDPEFGTGCVKITPAHDFNDYQVGQRHTMEVINLFTPQAILNENAPVKYQGLERFAAREAIVADLEKAGLLEKVEEHMYKRPYGDRSGVVIEPYFTEQWYVKMERLAERASEVVRNNGIRFVPEHWKKTYFNWMDNIEDWCISRQLLWGHRIPAWFDQKGNIYVGKSEEQVRKKNNLGDIPLRQETDVLDTWFSSALWTFATLGWPEKTQKLQHFHPTSVLVTGFDIIFFWVARMIAMSQHLLNQVPFHTVYIHGLVRDAEGQKMSKSKGNVIDPIDIVDGITLEKLVQKRTSNMMQPELSKDIEEQTRRHFPKGIARFGVDSLRMTFASLASTGRDIRFDIGRVEGYKYFCNKLWNASRYVSLQTQGFSLSEDYTLTTPDKWIITRLQKCEQSVHTALETYRLDLASQAIYDTIWHEYCDWYLELTKPLLNDPATNKKEKQGIKRTLLLVQEALLRLLHPFMPFITEQLWQHIKSSIGKGKEISIMTQPYPQAQRDKIDNQAEKDIQWLQELITATRSLRSEYKIAQKTQLRALIVTANEHEMHNCQHFAVLISALTGICAIKATSQPPTSCLLLLVGTSRMYIPMEGLLDIHHEKSRLLKEQQRLHKEQERLKTKLANTHFLEKAPQQVITQQRNKLRKVAEGAHRINEQLQQLA